MKYIIVIALLLTGGQVSAQEEDSNKIFIRVPSYPILTDSEWARQSIGARIRYSLDHGETYSQLCGYHPHDTGRDVQQYIYSNTRQLHFLDEWFYSKRQVDLFNTYPDSVTLLLREDLFEKKKDLFYWHNIILRMDPDGDVANALYDYYRNTGESNSVPLTLLANWMYRDSFPAYRSSGFPERFRSEQHRILHSIKNKSKFKVLLDEYIRELGYSGRTLFAWQLDRINDSLRNADTVYRRTWVLSEQVFERLSPTELLSYCESRPEKYLQICAGQPGIDPYKNIYSNVPLGWVRESSYSERQRSALVANRDTLNSIMASDIRSQPLSRNIPYSTLLEICNTVELIPDIVRRIRLHIVNSPWQITLLCRLLFKNDYRPFTEFWQQQSSSGDTIPRTEANINRILNYSLQFATKNLKR